MLPSLQSIFSMPSSATTRVEKATSRLLLNPDWMMNKDICNSINSDPWKAKSFVKAVKLRLQNKNSKVQFLSLMLLQTMIKKCDDFVHFQVVERGILSEMVRILRKTKNMQVRETILVLLQSWQEAFRGPDGRYPQFYNTYAELKRAGVEFPPNKNISDLKFAPAVPIPNQLQIGYEISTDTSGSLDEVTTSPTSHFSSSYLYNIRSVLELFTNMLKAVNPNDPKAIKDEVITDLKNQCDVSQKKLVQLINSTQKFGLLVEALSLNDSLQAVLSKYSTLLSTSSSPPTTATELPKQSLPPPTTSESSLYNKEEDEEEDDFSIIAKRKSIYNSSGFQEVSYNNGEQSNAIVLFDPPAPVSSSNKMDDMIDLSSPTFSATQSPLPNPSSNQNQNPISDSLSWEHYLNLPQTSMSNDVYNSYNSYIAPWARPGAAQLPEITPLFPQKQLQKHSPSHLQSSFSATEGSFNPFLSTNYIQYPSSRPI